MPATVSPISTCTDAPPRDPSAAPSTRGSTHFAASLPSHSSPPRSSASSAFTSDSSSRSSRPSRSTSSPFLSPPRSSDSSAPSAFSSPSLHDPDAMTDVRAHVLVNDLIKHDWSIAKAADAWHITYTQAELLVALPIVQREIESYRSLCDLRNSLLECQRGESSLRAQLRILELPLLDRDEPGYTCHAANARANLLRLTAMRVLSDRTPRGSSQRVTSSTPFHSSPPRSSAPSAFSSSSLGSSDFSIHIPTERARFDTLLESRAASKEARAQARASVVTTSNPSTSTRAPQPTPSPNPHLPNTPNTPDTTITRVACLLAEQACSDNSRPCPEAHACASAGMPPDTAPSDSSASLASSPSTDSSLPSPTACPAGALPDLYSASSLKDDADSSLRSSDSSALSAFSYPAKRARDHPAR